MSGIPFSLKVLGGFALAGPDGESLRSFSHRRAEATLAILAACGDLGCTRERLAALLWPESDDIHARHNLRSALHAIRRGLGGPARDPISCPSRESLALDPAIVWSDVQAFSASVEAEDWEAALALYRGPFLDGFHLNGAPEFERWLDAERERLRREATGAASRLTAARESTGELLEAAAWARRSLAIQPHDEVVARELLRLLAAAGDRAAAIESFERFASDLSADLDLEPSPETSDLVQQIRMEDETAASWRERRDAPVPVNAGVITLQDRPAPAQATRLTRRAGGKVRRRWLIGGRGARRTAGLAAAVTIAVILGVAFASRDRTPRLGSPVRITYALGAEELPRWSPDGRALAYQSEQDGDWDIWVTQLGTDQTANRTAGSAYADLHPTWSPDGQWIAFFSERDGGGYFLMPATGGPAREVARWPAGEVHPAAAAWSPDGSTLAYALGQSTEPRIELLTLGTGHARSLRLPKTPRHAVVLDLNWSPDGRFLAYRRAISPVAATSELWLTSVANAESVRLTPGLHADASPSWSPGARALYFVSDRGGSPDLWRLKLGDNGRPLGVPERLTTGLELTYAALSPDGLNVAYTRGRLVRNVFRVPLLPDRPATWGDVAQLTFDEADFESIDADSAGRLLLSSDRSGNWDIYLLPGRGRPLRPLTTHPMLDAGPRWQPHGTEVAFYSTRSGQRQIWVMPIGGGAPRQLTHGEVERLGPTWSPTGLDLAAWSGQGIVRLGLEGGTTRQLTDNARDAYPAWSPDGRWIAFHSTRTGPITLWRVPAAGGEPERLTDAEGRLPRWSADGRKIYFLGMGAWKNHLWELTLENGDLRPLAALGGRPGELGDKGLATDGQFAYFTWQQARGDIWVADIIRP